MQLEFFLYFGGTALSEMFGGVIFNLSPFSVFLFMGFWLHLSLMVAVRPVAAAVFGLSARPLVHSA